MSFFRFGDSVVCAQNIEYIEMYQSHGDTYSMRAKLKNAESHDKNGKQENFIGHPSGTKDKMSNLLDSYLTKLNSLVK